MLVFYLLIVEVAITKVGWFLSGQDSDKLAEKFVQKGPMKIQDKADRALEMMQKMDVGGVGGV